MLSQLVEFVLLSSSKKKSKKMPKNTLFKEVITTLRCMPSPSCCLQAMQMPSAPYRCGPLLSAGTMDVSTVPYNSKPQHFTVSMNSVRLDCFSKSEQFSNCPSYLWFSPKNFRESTKMTLRYNFLTYCSRGITDLSFPLETLG